MTESTKGTIYSLLAVAMFAPLSTGFKVAVSRLGSFAVVVWIGIWATAALFALLLRDGRMHVVAAELRPRPFFLPQGRMIGKGMHRILIETSDEH